MKEDMKSLDKTKLELMRKQAIACFKSKFINLENYFYFFKGLYYENIFDLDYEENMIKIIKSIKHDDLKLSDDMIIVKVIKEEDTKD